MIPNDKFVQSVQADVLCLIQSDCTSSNGEFGEQELLNPRGVDGNFYMTIENEAQHKISI